MNSVKILGKNVENPVARAAITILAVSISLGVVGVIMFAILPFVGVVIAGVMAVVFLIVLIIMFFTSIRNGKSGATIDIGSSIGEFPDDSTI